MPRSGVRIVPLLHSNSSMVTGAVVSMRHIVELRQIEGTRPQRPFPLHPAGRHMGVIHVRRRAEETLLAQFALERAFRQVAMRLARRPALDPWERNILAGAHRHLLDTAALAKEINLSFL